MLYFLCFVVVFFSLFQMDLVLGLFWKERLKANLTVWVEAAEAANPGGQLADAAYELGSSVDVQADALVGHVLLVGGTGTGAGDGDVAHPRGGG
jgi:hypothetical protein